MFISERYLSEIYPRLRRFARSRAGGDADVADSIVQSAMLMAIEYFERTSTKPENIEAWLINRIKWNNDTYFKKRKKETQRFGVQEKFSEDVEQELTARPQVAYSEINIEEMPDLNTVADDPEFIEKKQQCWDGLLEREREILEYSYGIKNKGYINKLEMLFVDMNKKTLANYLSKAKTQLINCLKGRV